tara:strand:- start:23295 stop:23756 length:462 start_codon:yes stop_codon:yes gene_type:complete
MQLKFRIILNVKDDVLRDVVTDSNITLMEFNKIIFTIFGFQTQEISTFFQTNDNWEQLEEVKIFKLDDKDEIMDSVPISNFLFEKNDKMIFIYDFLCYWTFFVELYDLEENKMIDKKYEVLNSVGMVPKNPPLDIFTVENNPDRTDIDENFDQ